MKRRGLFLDTGVLLASVLADDVNHERAVSMLEKAGAWRGVHTSDYVLAEGLNFIRQKVRRPNAAESFLALAFGSNDEPALVDSVLRVHGGRFAAALDRYRREFDRGLSFTDWTSVVLVEEENFGAIATFDKGFRGLVDVVSG